MCSRSALERKVLETRRSAASRDVGRWPVIGMSPMLATDDLRRVWASRRLRTRDSGLGTGHDLIIASRRETARPGRYVDEHGHFDLRADDAGEHLAGGGAEDADGNCDCKLGVVGHLRDRPSDGRSWHRGPSGHGVTQREAGQVGSRRIRPRPALRPTSAGGSFSLARLLALEADPGNPLLVLGAERSRNSSRRSACRSEGRLHRPCPQYRPLRGDVGALPLWGRDRGDLPPSAASSASRAAPLRRARRRPSGSLPHAAGSRSGTRRRSSHRAEGRCHSLPRPCGCGARQLARPRVCGAQNQTRDA